MQTSTSTSEIRDKLNKLYRLEAAGADTGDEITTLEAQLRGAWTCRQCGFHGYWTNGPHDCTNTSSVQQTTRGRPTIGDTPMTPAQRKARSRTLARGALEIDLKEAEQLANDWRRCMENGRSGATDKDIQGAFAEIALWIARARLQVTKL